MANDCGFCHVEENPDQQVILRGHAVLFLENKKEQGALRGSGVIVPVRHAETVFDLTPGELAATFAGTTWVELRGGRRADRHARPHARHSPVSSGAVRGTRHSILAEATSEPMVGTSSRQ